MADTSPLVSIGLPVFNGEAFLQEAIDSLLAQTYSNLEIVISDNGSTDATESICRSAAEKDSRISYHRNENNRGAAWNYNNVFNLSKGEYFKWAAHDDNCHPEFVKECLAVLTQQPHAVLSYPRTQVIDEKGGSVEMQEETLDLDSSTVGERFLCAATESSFRHNPVFGLIRRGALHKSALIQPYLASDICLLAELSLYGSFVLVPRQLFFRRKRPGNIGVNCDDLSFYDPKLKKCAVFSKCRLWWELVKSIWRAEIPGLTKVRLHGTMLRWTARHSWPIIAEIKEAISSYMEHYLGFGFKDIRKAVMPNSSGRAAASCSADAGGSSQSSTGDGQES